MQDQTMKLGLLLEAAHAQQTLAETSLERLTAHVRDLDDIVRGETVNRHPLSVVRYHTVAEVRDCQILFIAASELPQLEGILAALRARSILTVTDADSPAVRGVMIGLVRQEKRIRLRIDLQAAKASNLTISSKLLRPAEIVGSGS